MLTEEAVQRSFRRQLAQTDALDMAVFDKLETLLDQLRPESPLRHRLECELEEVKRQHEAQAG